MQYVASCAQVYRDESNSPRYRGVFMGVTASATPCYTHTAKMCSQFALWGYNPQKSKQTGVRTHANT